MARRRTLPSGFRRASGGVSASADAARRRRVRKEKERIEREARLAKLRTDRQAKAWAAPRSVFIPRDLRKKPKPAKAKPRTFASDKAARETYVTSGGKTKRRLATKKQRARLESAQSAKRQRLARLALERPTRLHTAKQPRTLSGGVHPGTVATGGARAKRLKREYEQAKNEAVRLHRTDPRKAREAHSRMQTLGGQMVALGITGQEEGLGFISRFAQDMVNIARETPVGIYHAGQQVGKDVEDWMREGDVTPERTFGLAKQTAESTVEDIRHPLRHPGYTALDILGAVSLGTGAGARVAATGKALRAGEGARAVTKAVARGAPRQTRMLRLEGWGPEGGVQEVAAGFKAKPGAKRLIQDFMDKRVSPARFGRAWERQRRYQMQQAKGGLRRLPRLTTLQATAIKVKANGVPVEDVIARHRNALAQTADKATQRRLAAEVKLLMAAKEKYVRTENGVPVLVGDSKRLTKQINRKYDRMREFSRLSEEYGIEAGVLDPGAAAARIQAPGRILLDDPEFQGGDFYMPERLLPAKGREKGGGGVGGADRVGILRKMNSQRQYRGILLKNALARRDLARVLGENDLSRRRFVQIQDMRTRLIEMGSDTNQWPGRQPEWLGNRANAVAVRVSNKDLAPAFRQFLEGPEDMKFTNAELKLLDKMFEDFNKDMFVDPDLLEAGHTYKFVPRQLLSREMDPAFNIGNNKWAVLLGRGLGSLTDLTRMMVLYLKPAYLIPNMVGNAFMLATKGGFADPKSLMWSVRMAAQHGQKNADIVDGVMGEGAAKIMVAEKTALSRATSGAAGMWSWLVDVPFRRASFFHSARKAGFNTKAKIDQLLNDPKHAHDLQAVATEANKDLIDYSDMTPFERNVIRNVIFFYPWVKGSTMYAGRFVGEHPVQAAILAGLGREGEEQIGLKGEPSFMEGSFEAGGGVVNPAAAAIFNTPAAAGETIVNLAQGRYDERAYRPGEWISPAIAFMMTGLTGLDLDNNVGLDEPAPLHSIVDLLEKSPQGQLILRIRRARSGEDQSQRLFPMTEAQAWQQFLVGGIAPRSVNYEVMREMGAREKGQKSKKHISIGGKDYTYAEWLRLSNKWSRNRTPAVIKKQAQFRVRLFENLSGLEGRERTLELIDTAADVYPGELGWRDWARRAPESQLQGINDKIYEDLFGGDGGLNAWNNQMADQGVG